MKPILFSTEMVRAIMDGRKTQTRRVVKFPLKSPTHHISVGESDAPPSSDWAPFQPGDILYVRETWCSVDRDHAHDLLEGRQENSLYQYRASVHEDWMTYAKERYGYKWQPSLFMPKSAARIFLRVTDVRAERLQEISEADAIAEGAKDVLTYDDFEIMKGLKFIIPRPFLQHQFGFLALWCRIHSPESWDSNPWVWVYTFQRIEKP